MGSFSDQAVSSGVHDSAAAAVLSWQERLINAQAGIAVSIATQDEVVVNAQCGAIAHPVLSAPWVQQGLDLIRQHDMHIDQVLTLPLRTQQAGSINQFILVTPLKLSGHVPQFIVLLKTIESSTVLSQVTEALSHSGQLIETLAQSQSDPSLEYAVQRLKQAMGILLATNEHDRFRPLSMRCCNELAAVFSCERVSLGMKKGNQLQVQAMSHTENFSRNMQLVQAIEAAMEECLDQDIEIIHPATDEEAAVNRLHQALTERHHTGTVASLPLRGQSECFGVMTLERNAGKPFTAQEVETLRLIGELCGPRFVEVHRRSKWFGARLVDGARSGLKALLGPAHTGAKLLILAIIGMLFFCLLARGTYRVEATFTFEAVVQQVITAPFDGYLADVHVEVGQRIEKDKTLLAQFDVGDIQLQRSAQVAEQTRYRTQLADARSSGSQARAALAQAGIDRTQAQIDLYDHMIEQSQIRSRIDGLIVRGDLKKQIGAPVQSGDVIFEVTPLQALRAQLLVPEHRISEVVVGQRGQLATIAFPQRKIDFTIERITPIAEVEGQKNVFKVRVQLDERHDWMRPGMEGIAKVDIERRHLIRIWTEPLVNWIRMKLWI